MAKLNPESFDYVNNIPKSERGVANILRGFDIPDSGELFQTIIQKNNVKIERIVSSDVIPDKVYNQDHDELVLILEGKAELEIESRIIKMDKMDYIFIKSGKSHKVIKASKGTVWLAIHIY